ncbi:MAG TPA: glycoside hydrolase family 3 N-terminal domain-containing protein [Pyrinomonadaceae bacterium]|jgi:beta-N-acetylhexosaminidase|nr:glycoside hydrolase family 3 N-terminal domain-containing protein [Pyrinomonadaceae bacterium]
MIRTLTLLRPIVAFVTLAALFLMPLGALGARETLIGTTRVIETASVSTLDGDTRRLTASPAPYPGRPSASALKWAGKELAHMSLDEKIGQLISVGVNATFLNQDSEAFRALRKQVQENKIGGIILFRGPVYESVILVNRMQELAQRPLLISADLEAGAGMRFDDTVNVPWNMAVGATGNPEYARRQGLMTAREARALGVEQIFAPVVDVNNNAANPVINVRSYGEDPNEVARFATAFVEGAQAGGVIATAKHFPGHGDTAIDSHRGLPVINVGSARLNSVELVSFRAAIAAGVGSVMTGHIGLPQIDPTTITPLPRNSSNPRTRPYADSEVIVENATLPATLSPVLTGRLLRTELGFDGIVVTDALDMSGLTIYFNQDEAAVRAVLAGADMLLKPSDPDACIRGLREAVRSGRLTEKRIEESARRLLAAKYDLGLVKGRLTSVDGIDRIVSSPDSLKLAQEIAEHALTLVRDEAQLVPASKLPMSARIFNLAITNGEDRLWIAQPFVAALARAGRRVETIVLDERSSEAEVRKALERADGADLVIASLYGRVRSGQSSSVGLPEAGARALSALISKGAPLVGISFGNPYLLMNFPQMRTYLVAYGDMPSLQAAAARALLGETDIGGKLPITLPSLYTRGAGIQLKATHPSSNAAKETGH